MSKNLKITAIILAVLLLGASIILFYVLQPKSPSPPTAEQIQAKLKEMSESLTVMEQTPKVKAKLLEMSKSLNK
jgi:hypothetical protein